MEHHTATSMKNMNWTEWEQQRKARTQSRWVQEMRRVWEEWDKEGEYGQNTLCEILKELIKNTLDIAQVLISRKWIKER